MSVLNFEESHPAEAEKQDQGNRHTQAEDNTGAGREQAPTMDLKIGIRRRPTLPRNCSRSTIGAEELNDRVRDGNGCGLLAIATAN